jgi:hypothetical protein
LPIPDRQSSLVEKKFCDETFAASGPERSAMQPSCIIMLTFSSGGSVVGECLRSV